MKLHFPIASWQVNVGFSHHNVKLAMNTIESEKRLIFGLETRTEEEPPKKKKSKKTKDKKDKARDRKRHSHILLCFSFGQPHSRHLR